MCAYLMSRQYCAFIVMQEVQNCDNQISSKETFSHTKYPREKSRIHLNTRAVATKTNNQSCCRTVSNYMLLPFKSGDKTRTCQRHELKESKPFQTRDQQVEVESARPMKMMKNIRRRSMYHNHLDFPYQLPGTTAVLFLTLMSRQRIRKSKYLSDLGCMVLSWVHQNRVSSELQYLTGLLRNRLFGTTYCFFGVIVMIIVSVT